MRLITKTKKAFAIFCIAILTASCVPGTTSPQHDALDATILPACTADATLFALLPFDKWGLIYHELTDAAISAHLNSFTKQGSDSPFFSNLQCSAPDSAGLLQPSGPLFLIATKLPPWRDPKNLARLSEQDFGVVLLEFLRIYECALKIHRDFLDINIVNDNALRSLLPFDLGQFGAEHKRRKQIIETELLIARSALERILMTTGSLDRLWPFLLDLECIERASLDLRNVTGLVSESASCMPRLWDARGSLRDPSP